MIEIRGQQASDWQDLYQIRLTDSSYPPYIRPDWVKEELSEPQNNHWPMVAVEKSDGKERVVARCNAIRGTLRRSHHARMSLEYLPNYTDAARKLLNETVQVNEQWLQQSRLQIVVPSSADDQIEIIKSCGFVQEARLQDAIRIDGKWADELVFARVNAPQMEPVPPEDILDVRPKERVKVTVRGGASDDWAAIHNLWSQPSVIWGTLQIPYPSMDMHRKRIVEQTPAQLWPLTAIVADEIVGNCSVYRDKHNRSHVGHIGMMVDKEYQGMGVGNALMEAIMSLAHGWLGLKRLQLEVFTDNHRAVSLYEKFSFAHEGILRAYGFRQGIYADVHVMGLILDRQ